MNSSKANDMIDSMCNHLINSSPVYLKVNITDNEQAEQIIEWMFNKNQELIKAELLEVAWDQELVSKEDAESIRRIKEA